MIFVDSYHDSESLRVKMFSLDPIQKHGKFCVKTNDSVLNSNNPYHASCDTLSKRDDNWIAQI